MNRRLTEAIVAIGVLTTAAAVVLWRNRAPAPASSPTARERMRPSSPIESWIRAKDWTSLRTELAQPKKAENALGQMIRHLDTETTTADVRGAFYDLTTELLTGRPSEPRLIVLSTHLLAKLPLTPAQLDSLEKIYVQLQSREQARRSWLEISVSAVPFPARATPLLDGLLKSKNAGEVREGLYLVSRLRDPAARKDLEGRVVRNYFRSPAAARPYLYKEIFSSFHTPPSPPVAEKMKARARLEKSDLWNEVLRITP